MRQSLKFWRRHRAAALWVAGSLGVAIGLATAAWSIAEAAWFRPAPGVDPDRLVSVGLRDDQGDRTFVFSFADYLTVKDRQDVFAGVAAISKEDDWFLATPGEQIPLNAARVTANLLDLMGIVPLFGRSLAAADEQPGVPEVAIVSYRFWRSALGGSEAAIGRRVPVSVPFGGTRPVQIAAVLPPGAVIRIADGIERDFLVSLPEEWRSRPPRNRGAYDPTILARLRPGISISAADARLTALWQEVGSQTLPPRLPPGVRAPGARTSFLLPLHEFWYGSARGVLLRLGAVAGLVIVVACTNVLGVLMALATARSREFAIRCALGESPRHAWQMALLEIAPVALAATVIAVVSARGLLAAFADLAPSGVPRLSDAHVDWRAMAVGLTAALLTLGSMGIAVSTLQGRRRKLLPVLQCAGTSTMTPAGHRVRRALIAAQVGVVIALLTATSLVAGSLWRLLNQPLGFNISSVLSAGVITSRDDLLQEPGRYMQFIDDMRREVLAAPGHREVAVTVDPPLGRSMQLTRVTFLDGHYRAVETKSVSEGYFGVMGIPILAGRDFNRADRDGCALLVNSTFARSYLDGIAGSVGRQVILGGGRCQVVGVAGDVREGPLADAIAPAIYPVFSAGRGRRQIYLVTRESGSPQDHTGGVREAILRADPTAYAAVAPLSARVAVQSSAVRAGTIGLGALGGFTLLLACLGIAATIAQVSVERRRELAIRTALGASARSVVVLMTRVVMLPTGWGIVIGAVLSGWSAPLLDRLLFGTSPFDPVLWCVGIGLVVTVVGVAAWIPARRVGAVDPLTLLRQE